MQTRVVKDVIETGMFLSKRRDNATIESGKFVEYLKGKLGIDAIDVGEAAILCYSGALFSFSCIDKKTAKERANHWLFLDRESRGCIIFS